MSDEAIAEIARTIEAMSPEEKKKLLELAPSLREVTRPDGEDAYMNAPLWDIPEVCAEDAGVEDLAENHDHYIYGTFRFKSLF